MIKEESMKDLTILINTCDAYEDIWAIFFTLFNKYWANCNLKIVLNTETKTYQFDELDIVCFQLYNGNKCKQVTYGKRLIDTLKRIETPYILWLMDDFFIRSPVDIAVIEKCLNAIRINPDIACFSFDAFRDELNVKSEHYTNFMLRPTYGDYKLNFQAGIWNRKTLIKLLRSHENPWETEIRGSLGRCANTKYRFYALEKFEMSPINYGNSNEHKWGIRQGKWVLDDVKPVFEANGIDIDYSQRGILLDEIPVVNSNNSWWHKARSYGVFTWIKICCWMKVNERNKTKGKMVYRTYMDYKREKTK